MKADLTTMSEDRRVLGLFAKWPQPGQVKTRLAAVASPEWAAQVAEAFLHDTVDRLAAVPVRRVLVFTPPTAEASFAELVAGRFDLMPQAEGDLGQRMAAFFAAQVQVGADRIVVLGTDSPSLPLAYVEQAFQALDQADVVLGPAMDGGYYLLGCTRRLPPIFDGIPWSTAGVLAATVDRLPAADWKLALLPPWYDVDTPDDWRMLQGHLQALRRAGIDPAMPRTERLARERNSVG
jgi:rSAM/selenodomain-associated transferase 1